MQWYAIDGRPISVWHQSKAGVVVEGNSLVVVCAPTGTMVGSISYWRNKSGPQGAAVSWPAKAQNSTGVKPNLRSCLQ